MPCRRERSMGGNPGQVRRRPWRRGRVPRTVRGHHILRKPSSGPDRRPPADGRCRARMSLSCACRGRGRRAPTGGGAIHSGRFMSQQFSGAAAIRAAVMIMGSTYVTYAVGLLVSIVIARDLGPEDYGRYAYVVWMAGMLLAIANNGLTSTSIRFVSESLGRRSPESARRVHGWLLRRQIVCMVLVALGFVAASRWLAPDGWQGPLAWFVLVALVAGLTKAVYIFDASVAKGYGRFDVEARATVAMSFLSLVLVLALALVDAPLLAYLGAFTLASVGHTVMSRRMLRRGGIKPEMVAPEPELEGRLRQHLLWTVVLV